MTTDDEVTSESTLVNVRLLSGSVLPQICMFSDSDIGKCIVIVYL